MDGDLANVVASTAEAAFVTDEEETIISWNEAAQSLLGWSAEEVLGKACFGVLCGVDAFGNRYCKQECAVKEMAKNSEPIHRYQLIYTSKEGKPVPVEISIVVVSNPGSESSQLVHLIRPLAGGDGPLGEPTRGPVSTRNGGPEELGLSDRELEILRLLASGKSSREAANELGIKYATVRNHVQNILRKLGVHSRVEAVSLALRNKLI
ncbi:MAG TPA: LuxR C-terminal-related transcriptional regulator [Thermoanaerobaculia bacterium]|nr:LuxR C-terminal-related transcriptional regulator [Thermoanaerobaculia bacterium]